MNAPKFQAADEAPLVERVPAPEILVDGYSSSLVCAGVAKLSFFSTGFAADGVSIERQVVLRLAASLPVMAAAHEALGRFLEQVSAAQSEQPN